jgi:hypothetical protein
MLFSINHSWHPQPYAQTIPSVSNLVEKRKCDITLYRES